MHKRTILAVLAFIAAGASLQACDQAEITPAAHPLLGAVYADKSVADGFEMAFLSMETVELRLFDRTQVAACTWADVTSQAEARGENTTFRVVSQGPWAERALLSTGRPASHRIEVTCPRPLGSGQFRFEMAFTQDTSSATRLQVVDEIAAELFATGTGQFDVGRTVTRVGEEPTPFTASVAEPLFGMWRTASSDDRCRPAYGLGTNPDGDFSLIFSDNGEQWIGMTFHDILVEGQNPLSFSGVFSDDLVYALSQQGDELLVTASDGSSCTYTRER